MTFREQLADHLSAKVGSEPEETLGIAFVYGEGDGPVTTASFGSESHSSSAPVTEQSRFYIGSLTKLILASYCLKLAQEGRIHLDAKVGELDTRFEGHPAQSATIRELLTHTSGLPRDPVWFFEKHSDCIEIPYQEFTFKDLFDESLSLGEKTFEYSNLGYVVLGQVLEAVVGQEFADYMGDYVRSIGMTDTFIASDARRREVCHSSDVQSAEFGLYAPVGGLVATAANLGRFCQHIVRDSTCCELFAADTAQPDGEVSRWGLRIRAVEQFRVVFATGFVKNSKSALFIDLERQRYLAYASNSPHHFALIWEYFRV